MNCLRCAEEIQDDVLNSVPKCPRCGDMQWKPFMENLKRKTSSEFAAAMGALTKEQRKMAIKLWDQGPSAWDQKPEWTTPLPRKSVAGPFPKEEVKFYVGTSSRLYHKAECPMSNGDNATIYAHSEIPPDCTPCSTCLPSNTHRAMSETEVTLYGQGTTLCYTIDPSAQRVADTQRAISGHISSNAYTQVFWHFGSAIVSAIALPALAFILYRYYSGHFKYLMTIACLLGGLGLACSYLIKALKAIRLGATYARRTTPQETLIEFFRAIKVGAWEIAKRLFLARVMTRHSIC